MRRITTNWFEIDCATDSARALTQPLNRRRCLIIAVMALAAPVLIFGGPVEPFREPYNRFAKAITAWVKRILAISPSSLDFREVGAEAWHELQIGQLFRELEEVVTDLT